MRSTDRSAGRAPARWIDAGLLAGILLLAALAFGSVHDWAAGLVQVAVSGLAAWCFVRPRRAHLPIMVTASIAALWMYLGLQLVPLPPSVIRTASPATAHVFEHTLGELPAESELAAEIRPVALIEDRKAPVETRLRIRTLAAAQSSWWPAGWHPLSLYPFATRRELFGTVAAGLAFAVAAILPTPWLLLRSIVGIGAGLAALGLVQRASWNGHVLWFFDPYDTGPLLHFDRVLGPFLNPNHFASLLVMCLLAGAALMAERWAQRRVTPSTPLAWTVTALSLAVMLAALVGTASRAALVALVLGLVPLCQRWWRHSRITGAARTASPPRDRRERSRRRFERILPVIVVLAIIAGGLLYAGSGTRSVLGGRMSTALQSSDELSLRFLMTRQSLPIIADFPLFGVGAGCWKEIFRRYASYPMVGVRPNHAHDDYVEWCAEVGFSGVALTLFAAWQIARFARRNDRIPGFLRAGFVGVVVAIGWHEAFDFGLRVPANALMFATLVGLLCNASWGRSESIAARDRSVGSTGRILVACSCSFVALASVGQIREFVQWLHARNGSLDLRFAPSNAETWHLVGVGLFDDGFRYFPPTSECFRRAILQRPTSAASFWYLARSAENRSDKLRLLEAALYLDPTHAPWRLQYAHLLELDGRRELALVEIEEAFRGDPRLAHHRYLDAADRPLDASLVAAARRGLAKAVALRPTDPVLLDQAATFEGRFGRHAEAAELWIRAIEITGAHETYALRAAESSAKAGDYSTAEALLRRLIGADPGRTEAYRALALNVYAAQQRWQEAESLLATASSRTSDPAALEIALFEVEKLKGDDAAALDALARAARNRDRDAGLQLSLGIAYLSAEDNHRAEAAFERAVAIAPSSAVAYFYRGVAAERRYDLAKALASYREAEKLEPDNLTYAKEVRRLSETLAAAAEKTGGFSSSGR